MPNPCRLSASYSKYSQLLSTSGGRLLHLKLEDLLHHGDKKTHLQIMAELIQAGGETLYYEFHKLINSIWNKEELTEQWTPNYTDRTTTACRRG
jgi:hypothetical protein